MSDESVSLRPAPCRVHLVVDEPAAADHFGPHGNIASAIATLIESEDGGRTIGLTGSYGSGKSTIVRILQSKWREKTRQVWVFDAWSHEGDPLRRTFLDSLTEHVIERTGWLNHAAKEDWKEKLEELRHPETVTTTHEGRRYSWLGLTMGLLLLLAPISLAALTAALRNNAVLQIGWPTNPTAWAATILLLPASIYVLAAGGLLIYNYATRRDVKQALQSTRDGLGDLLQKEGKKTTTSTVAAKDQTSLEFERHFVGLMNDSLKDDRRLIIVIDNLDRVEAEQAQRVWSTLRSFLDPGASAQSAAWAKRLWVIMPYDERAIRRLWHDEEGAVARSALEKSVQVRFNVPEAMDHDWESYLAQKLLEALPDHSEGEIRGVCRVVAAAYEEQARIPTPREIVTLVNDLATLHLQHGHEVDLPVQSFYVLTKAGLIPLPSRGGVSAAADGGEADGTVQAKGGFADLLVAGRVPDARFARLVGSASQSALAALHFGKDVRTAELLLLGPPLDAALAKGDAKTVQEICGAHPRAWDAARSIISKKLESWGADDVANVLAAAHALGSSGVLDSAPPADSNWLIGLVADALRANEALLPDGLVQRSGLLAATQLFQSRHMPALDPAALNRGLAVGLANGGAADSVENFLAARHDLEEAGFDVSSEAVIVGLEPVALIDVVSRALNHDQGSWSIAELIRPSDETSSKLNSHVKQQIESGSLSVIHAEAASVLVSSGVLDRDVLAAAEARLHANNGVGSAEISALLTLLLLSGKGREHLRKLSKGGHLHHHVSTASSKEATLALVIASFIAADEGMSPQTQVGNGASGQQHLSRTLKSPSDSLPEAVYRELVGADILENLFSELRRDSNTLLSRILQIMVGDPENDRFLTPEVVLWHWYTMHQVAEHPQQLLHRIADAEFMEAIMSAEFLLDYSLLYHDLLAVKPSPELSTFVLEGLGQLPADTIHRDLASSAPLSTPLARAVVEQGGRPVLSKAARDGALVHAEAVAKDESALADDCKYLLQLLAPEQHQMLADGMFDLLVTLQGNASEAFFTGFGPALAEARQLKSNDSRFLRAIVEPIVTDKHIPGLRWLAQLVRSDRRVFSALGRGDKKVFKSAVLESMARPPVDEADQLLDEIVRGMGWRVKTAAQ